MNEGVLQGVRVLDLSQVLAGSYCTMIMADHGAEVIKIEPPSRDTARGDRIAGLDRNKKSVVLDLKTEAGKADFRMLAKSADVIVETFHPGVMERLGLSYENLSKENPALVYAAIGDLRSAENPDAESATCNVVAQTIDGIMRISNPEMDTLTKPDSGVSDVFSGSMLSFGIVTALRHAEATGKGQIVDIAKLLKLPHTPLSPQSAGPRMGEHSDIYLSEMPRLPVSDQDRRALRDVFGAFATGVTVVTTRQPDGTPRGFTANSFTSVSLDPPLVLICIAKTANSSDVFCEASHFAVNVLSEEQKAISGLFASQSPDKFDQVDWQTGAANAPLITGSLANLVCARHKQVDAGDHIILIGEVIAQQTKQRKPLGYFKGNYFTVGLEDQLVAAASKSGQVEIGAVLARGNQILLCVDRDENVSIPKCKSTNQSVSALKSHFHNLGIRADIDFLYGVYHDTASGHHGIFYHGTAIGRAPTGHKFFSLKDIPLNKVTSAPERSMLERYREEFENGQFGIYQGDERTGFVHPVTTTMKSKY